MQVRRSTLFRSSIIQISAFEMRPTNDKCGEIQLLDKNVLTLPVAGVFAKHDGPKHHVVGTPSHAVLIANRAPFRLSFPGKIGDRALLLHFDDDLIPNFANARRASLSPPSHGVLPPQVMLIRNQLWAAAKAGNLDPLDGEAMSLDLLESSLATMGSASCSPPGNPDTQHRRSVNRVREAVATAPSTRWGVEALAHIACMSPFHFCRVFRAATGLTLRNYVLRERLAGALEPILDGGDLTTIALDRGFASHSHFTARFRTVFGCSPSQFRRSASASRASEIRKIVTARRASLV